MKTVEQKRIEAIERSVAYWDGKKMPNHVEQSNKNAYQKHHIVGVGVL